jgi:glycosyltransferase involved in cell wall biosynthesis
MKTISVIVPVYNGGEYLRKMAESLLAQGQELQVIFSDDGSTDETPAILEDLRKKDHRVTVVSGPNAGVSAARNRALKQATGEYIGFGDCDDLLEPGYLKALCAALEDTDADMACCGFYRVYTASGNTETLPTGDHPRQVVDRDGMAQLLLRPDGYTTVLWNKLFRRSALTGPDGRLIEFDETLHIVEDGEYILRSAVKKAVFFPEPLYRYFVRTSGAMYGPVTERKRTELAARKKIVDLTADLSTETQALAKMKYQKGVRDLCFHGVIGGNGAAVRDLHGELSVYEKELFSSPALSRKEKLKYHVYRPIICLNLRRLGGFLMKKLGGH